MKVALIIDVSRTLAAHTNQNNGAHVLSDTTWSQCLFIFNLLLCLSLPSHSPQQKLISCSLYVYQGLMSGNYSALAASFTLRRQNGYHLIQTYIPTILIVTISWVSFWVDPNAVPGRVTLGVTTLLTMTTISSGVRQTLPPVSYVKVCVKIT